MIIASTSNSLVQTKSGTFLTRDKLDDETKDLLEAGKNILEYCKQKRIKNVVILDKSGRFLSQYFQSIPGFSEVISHVFFVDHDRLLDTELRAKYYKRPKEISKLLSKNSLREVFTKETPYLFAEKSEPVLLLDEFGKSGKTIRSTQDAFERAGFQGIHTGVFFCHSGVEEKYDTVGKVRNTAPFFYNSDLNLIDHDKGAPNLISVPSNMRSGALELRKNIRASIERCFERQS